MGHAYIPGLKVARSAVVRKKRILPIQGDVLVKQGDRVESHTIIARTHLPGRVHVLNVVNQLGIAPDEIRRYMLKKENDPVRPDEAIAETKPLFKFLKATIKSPVGGVVESVSEVTGQVLLREPPLPLELSAYLDGMIVEAIPGEGAVVETRGMFVQGIFGVGGETTGAIEMVVEAPDRDLTPDRLKPEHRGKIVVGGALVVAETLKRAREIGVAAIVAGGLHDKDLRDLLGYDIGVAITGTESIGFTLIVTEGFGRISMAKRTFELLSSNRGKKASACGATQIRAGVVRPEIIVATEAGRDPSVTLRTEGLKTGDYVRVIREPYFGRLGRVVELPPDLQDLPTESKARVVKLDMGNGVPVAIPRTNVEILED